MEHHAAAQSTPRACTTAMLHEPPAHCGGSKHAPVGSAGSRARLRSAKVSQRPTGNSFSISAS
eukprot:4330415-Alexandrium_andersonii.AAC.1